MYYKKDEYYITDRDEYNITKYNTKEILSWEFKSRKR